MPRACPSESDEQAGLVAWLSSRDIRFFAVPNGSYLHHGNRLTRWALLGKLKREGMRPGAPDIVLIDLASDDLPVAVEMKRQRASTVSNRQRDMHSAMRRRGWHVVVAHGCDDAITQLRNLGYR